MGSWRVHYWQSDQTQVTLKFNTEGQARRYAERYYIKHSEDINPPDVYESESEDESEAQVQQLPQISRKQRLKELLVEWHRVYS